MAIAISSMAMCRRCLSLGLEKRRRQVALLDVLDQVPTDVEVVGDVVDGHAAPQFQGVALEGERVAASGVGEGDLDLADEATVQAFDPRDGEVDEGGSVADGQGPEAARDLAAGLELRRAAGGASAGLGLLVDGEDGLAVLVVGAGVTGSRGCRRRDTTGWWTC